MWCLQELPAVGAESDQEEALDYHLFHVQLLQLMGEHGIDHTNFREHTPSEHNANIAKFMLIAAGMDPHHVLNLPDARLPSASTSVKVLPEDTSPVKQSSMQDSTGGFRCVILFRYEMISGCACQHCHAHTRLLDRDNGKPVSRCEQKDVIGF